MHWDWLAIGLILGFVVGAMYGVRKQLRPRLRYLDHTQRVDHTPAAREPSIFDGSVGWEDPVSGEVVTPGQGWGEAK